MPLRVVGAILLALVAAFGAGWMVGASGKSAVEIESGRMEMRAEFAQARALVLDGRVNIFIADFGDAIERFHDARTMIARIQIRLREIGQAAQAGRLEIAISHLSDAEHLCGLLDPRAGDAADEALKALDAAGGGG